MKRSVYALFLFLTASVLLVSVIPLSDIPETAYNETETPVNQGPPVLPGTTFVRPPITSVLLPKRVREAAPRRILAAGCDAPPDAADGRGVYARDE